MVEFLHGRRWEKRNRNDFDWVMLLIYTIWKYWDILSQRLYIVQKLLRHFPIKIYIRKYLKQSSTCYNSKCFNSFVNNICIRKY